MKRSAGILLPMFSLPSEYGIGSLGAEARAFANFLQDAGQSWWQILPVGPVGAGDSPYASESTFAGNPLFIDLDLLSKDGLLSKEELDAVRVPAGDKIDYAALKKSREPLLRAAFSRVSGEAAEAARSFAEERPWVREYALYRSAKRHFGDLPWFQWPDEGLRRHEPGAVERWRVELAEEVAFETCLQYWFFTQWAALKTYVNGLGLGLIGDLPIYVSLDSADVWSERKEFLLDGEGKPSKVAGVPPDYFSEDGQLWGNPLYKWDYHRQTAFRWWCQRLEHCFKLYDVVRIDHFRGFDEYYSIPYGDETAEGGHWEKGPGMELFHALRKRLGDKEIIAEDLGFLTDSVVQLLKDSGYPGMKVLEFAFDPREETDYLPHSYDRNCVVYTGTHDNETLVQWYKGLDEESKAFAAEYMNNASTPDEEKYWDFVRMAMMSSADTCIIPIQDYLGLDAEARINKPSTLGGNWEWRMSADMLDKAAIEKIYRLTRISSRLSEEKQREENEKKELKRRKEQELKEAREKAEAAREKVEAEKAAEAKATGK